MRPRVLACLLIFSPVLLTVSLRNPGHRLIGQVHAGEAGPFFNRFISGQVEKGPGYYHELYDDFLVELFLTSWIPVLAIALPLFAPFRTRRMLARCGRWLDRMVSRERSILGILLVGGLVVDLLVADRVLDRFPTSADEYVYQFQALTYLEGRLWNDSDPAHEHFESIHIGNKNGKWVGQFPPGWPVILALFRGVGIPFWVVSPILATLALWLNHHLARTMFGVRVALVTSLTVASTPMFVFNAASGYSHIPCMVFCLIFAASLLRHREDPRARWAFLGGIALAVAYTIRYYSALLFAVPVFLGLLVRRRLRGLLDLAIVFAGSFGVLVLDWIYNYRITGVPFFPTYTWVNPINTLGFVYGHDLLQAMLQIAKRTVIFMHWASPALPVIYLAGLLLRARRCSTRALEWTFMALVGGYVFYMSWAGGQYGTRFYFEAFPLLVTSAVASIGWLGRCLHHPEGRPDDPAPGRLFSGVILAYLLGWAFSVGSIPLRARNEYRVIQERQDLYRKVRDAGLHDALVLIESGTGVQRPVPAMELVRNGISLTASVLYARDLEGKRAALRARFPGRSIYRYRRAPDSPDGTLELLELPAGASPPSR